MCTLTCAGLVLVLYKFIFMTAAQVTIRRMLQRTHIYENSSSHVHAQLYSVGGQKSSF